MRLSRTVLALAVLAPLAACGTVAETVNGPKLTPMAYPASAPMTPAPMAMAPQPMPAIAAQPGTANSLWRTGSRAFFNDQRASKIGDVLTVLIDIRDNAKVQNQTSTGRETSVDNGVSNFFGLENQLPSSMDPSHLITTGSTSSLSGQGSVNRSEAVSLTIAAIVSGVLPNGNLVIQGRQEVRINQELRELIVAGIVRPEDITSTNTIRHTQIAEARVSYGGRGAISRVQRVPAGQALVEQYWPF